MKTNKHAKRLFQIAPIALAIAQFCATNSWSQEATKLAPIEIQVEPAPAPYSATRTSSATKNDTPLLETPMAVQVVPRDVIDDRLSRTGLQVISNVSGVQPALYQFYDFYQLRGFTSTYGNVFRDGLQLQGINGAENLAFVESVEVVKGPSSVLYGQIDPGGFVNMVTKKPQAEQAISLEQQFGSWGSSRSTFDATGKLSDDGALLYRFIFDADKADSWVDNVHHDNTAFAASVSWKPSARLESNFQLEHYNSKLTWPEGTVPVIGDQPANLPRNFTSIYPASWTDYPYTVDRSLLAYSWNYLLDSGWKVTNRFHYLTTDENQRGVYADGFDGVDTFATSRFTNTAPWARETYNTNLDIQGDIKLGSVTHKLLVGTDWSQFTDRSSGSTGSIPGAPAIQIYNPVFANIQSTLQGLAAADAGNIIYTDKSTDFGLYFQDQIALNSQWNALVGGRWDWATSNYATTYGDRSSGCYPTCTGEPVISDPDLHEFSPRAGLLFKATPEVSIYASYSKSFGLGNGASNTGEPFPPEVGEQYELGTKWTALGGKVTASLTYFDLTKKNIAQYDPVTYDKFIVGEVNSKGIEFDIAGQVSKNISVIGSYTYDDAIITRDPLNGTQLNHFSGVAPQVASVWTKYDSAPGAQTGWAFGVGLYGSSARWGDDANTWQLPGYGRLDAMVGYRTGLAGHRVTAQLNVNNLLDKWYFESGSYGMAAYGAPRNILASLKVEL